MIPLNVVFQAYQRGAGGIPSTANPLITPTLESYTHSISATGGFESCSVQFKGTLNNVVYWLINGLAASVQCFSPDGMQIWEGYLSGISATIGQERIDLGIDDMANAVRVRYQSGIGAQDSTAFATFAASIAQYGRKELIHSGSGMTATGATVLRDTLLNQRSWPVAQRAATIATKSGNQECSITLNCAGWYYTLDWLTTASSTSATAITTTQVANLLSTAAATNAFISTATVEIQSSGQSETQWIDADTLIRARIEQLLALGTSSGQRIAYGVYEDRVFRAKTWAGAAPDVISYQRYLGDTQIYTPGGGAVDWWLVRPDAMYQVIDLIDTSALIAGADNIASFYVERVTATVDASGASAKLEPARSNELDVLLARIRS